MSYFEHAHSPYPLEDAEKRTPYDALVDLSLTVDPDVFAEGVKLTAMKITPAFVFVAFETPSRAVAHAFIETPASGRIYQLECQEGSGWVMFGPGVRKAFELEADVQIDVDPKALIIEDDVTPGFTLEVNGRQYPMPSTLTILADGFAQSRVEDPRDLDSGAAAALVISRNDAVINERLLTGGLLAGGNPPIRRLGPATPDEAGNIDIRVTIAPTLVGDSGVISVPCDNPEVAAFILWSSGVLGCPPSDLLDQLRFSDCGEGRPYELPFDKLLQKFKGDITPCGPDAPECESSLGTEG